MKSEVATTFAYVLILAAIIGGLFLLPTATAAVIPAKVNIDPDQINLKDTDWDSPVILAQIRFSQPYKDRIDEVNVSTVLLDGVIPALRGDISKSVAKIFFDRQVVYDYLWLLLAHMGYTDLPFRKVPIELTVTGQLNDGTPFEGSDTIYVSAK